MGLGVGIVLLLPQLVVALFRFLLTLGFIRFGTLGYRVLRERVPPIGRGWLALSGALGAIVGSVIWAQVRLALQAA